MLYIRDEHSTAQAILAINFDITALQVTQFALGRLTGTTAETASHIHLKSVSAFLDDLTEESVERVGKPVALMSKREETDAIHLLSQMGTFLITRAEDRVSHYFGISKYTLYSCIETGKS